VISMFAAVAAAVRANPEKYQKVNLFETDRTALDVYTLLPGQSQKLHAHRETDKYYVILEGEAEVQIGTEVRALGPGEAALARPGVEHSIANRGTERLVALVFQSPKTW
jgi:mannose-6-phosphate isomerase-like protein (cupin superfamily)